MAFGVIKQQDFSGGYPIRIEKEAILDKTRLMAQAAADAENMQVEATRDLMAAVAEAFRGLTPSRPEFQACWPI